MAVVDEVLDGVRRVELDKSRTLRMDFNALAKAEDLTGKNFLDVETWKTLRATDYRALAWACLTDDDTSLTLEQVGKLMTPKYSNIVSDALLELYLGQVEKPIDDKETAKAPFENAGGEDGS